MSSKTSDIMELGHPGIQTTHEVGDGEKRMQDIQVPDFGSHQSQSDSRSPTSDGKTPGDIDHHTGVAIPIIDWDLGPSPTTVLPPPAGDHVVDERRLVRKLDLNLIPLATILYCFSFLDRWVICFHDIRGWMWLTRCEG